MSQSKAICILHLFCLFYEVACWCSYAPACVLSPLRWITFNHGVSSADSILASPLDTVIRTNITAPGRDRIYSYCPPVMWRKLCLPSLNITCFVKHGMNSLSSLWSSSHYTVMAGHKVGRHELQGHMMTLLRTRPKNDEQLFSKTIWLCFTLHKCWWHSIEASIDLDGLCDRSFLPTRKMCFEMSSMLLLLHPMGNLIFYFQLVQWSYCQKTETRIWKGFP